MAKQLSLATRRESFIFHPCKTITGFMHKTIQNAKIVRLESEFERGYFRNNANKLHLNLI